MMRHHARIVLLSSALATLAGCDDLAMSGNRSEADRAYAVQIDGAKSLLKDAQLDPDAADFRHVRMSIGPGSSELDNVQPSYTGRAIFCGEYKLKEGGAYAPFFVVLSDESGKSKPVVTVGGAGDDPKKSTVLATLRCKLYAPNKPVDF